MTILRWNPAEELYSLRREMSRLMRLPLDAYASDEELVITATVPGLDPDDVEKVMEDDVLTITGELRAPLENVTYLSRGAPVGGSAVR